MILIKQGHVFAPENLGTCDILIGGNQILAVEKNINAGTLPGKVREIDARGMGVVPGFIDGHQHFTGGGGEDGFKSRVPEMRLSANIANGVTTAVGLLGTDSLTRTVESLYARTRALNDEGMTALMLTGAYWLPSPTVCGSVGRDITFLDPVIGVKLAISDHRSACYDTPALAALAREVRVAAMVSGKPGIITLHTGADPAGLDMLLEATDRFGIKAGTFVPTHVNLRTAAVADQAFALARQGSFADATCLARTPDRKGAITHAADFAAAAEAAGVFEQVCFSSDAGGSLPRWNPDRTKLLGMGMGTPDTLITELQHLVRDHNMDLSRALLPLTLTPARTYGLSGKKGVLCPGAHADILVLEKDSLEIRDVMAKGRVMMAGNTLETSEYFSSGK